MLKVFSFFKKTFEVSKILGFALIALVIGITIYVTAFVVGTILKFLILGGIVLVVSIFIYNVFKGKKNGDA
jgi:hypothetical protein